MLLDGQTMTKLALLILR